MRYAFLIICLYFLSFQGVFSQEQPNIILIMADDLGYEALAAYGNDYNQTPHLDKMIAGGMKFENAHSMPLCTPSRVQLMTGKYNFRNYKGFGILDPKHRAMLHVLLENGNCMGMPSKGNWLLVKGEVCLLRQVSIITGFGRLRSLVPGIKTPYWIQGRRV